MADLLRIKKMKIERKYKRLIGQTLEKFKDKTWGELNGEFDKIKKQMKSDFEKAGICLNEC